MLQLHLSDQQFYCLLKRDLYYRFNGDVTNNITLLPHMLITDSNFNIPEITENICQEHRCIEILLERFVCKYLWSSWWWYTACCQYYSSVSKVNYRCSYHWHIEIMKLTSQMLLKLSLKILPKSNHVYNPMNMVDFRWHNSLAELPWAKWHESAKTIWFIVEWYFQNWVSPY